MDKKIRVLIELLIGFGLGISSIEEIFSGVFHQMFINENNYAIIGWFTAVFVSIISFIDSIAVLSGWKNLGHLLSDVEL